MTIAECLKYNVVPLQEGKETNDNKIDQEEINKEIVHKLIPSIHSVFMIADMIDTQALGPIELGPYSQYIQDLKSCALQQDEFTKELISFMRQDK